MRRRSKTLYLMLRDKVVFTRRYTSWIRSGVTNALLDAGEDEVAVQAEVIYPRDFEGRALAQAYLAGAQAYAAFLTGFATESEVAHSKEVKEVPVDFNFDEFTNTGLNMPTRESQ